MLATTRPIFGSETIEYRLPTHTRFGAMLGIKEYATPTAVGMFNRLLSAPFEFVLTQSFAFLTKATGQRLLQRQHHQMSNAGDFAVSQAEELKDALDSLTANEFVLGEHHFSLQVISSLTGRSADDAEQVWCRSYGRCPHARDVSMPVGRAVAIEPQVAILFRSETPSRSCATGGAYEGIELGLALRAMMPGSRTRR